MVEEDYLAIEYCARQQWLETIMMGVYDPMIG